MVVSDARSLWVVVAVVDRAGWSLLVVADAHPRSWVLRVGGWCRSWAFVVCVWLGWALCSLVGLGHGRFCGGGSCLTSYGDGVVVG